MPDPSTSRPKERRRPKTDSIGLPPRIFLFTLDQLAVLLALRESTLRKKHIFFDAVDPGPQPPGRMMARNIGTEEAPDWRVAERELVRWTRLKGFHLYERGWVTR